MKLPLSVNHYHLEDADGECVAATYWAGKQVSDFADDDKNLADIARAVNNHAALVDVALTLCNQFLQAGISAVQDSDDPAEMLHFKARAALAAAKGEADASN